jgi:transglutaminase-like putative cysteine protease
LDSGTVVAIEYEQRRRPYLLADEWSFQERIAVVTARYRLVLPASWEYSDFWVRHERVKGIEQAINVWFWELKDIPAIEREPAMPYWGAVAGRMMLSFHGNIRGNSTPRAVPNWNDLASWYVGLAQDRAAPSTQITAMARQLTANSPDFLSKVSALTRFLQSQVRYVAIEIRIGGYQPHAAADTFKNRYGDCKDTSNSVDQHAARSGYWGCVGACTF